ncbi:PREDICTED: uncharacterized protein LOC106125434 [Papilio xuthus]|uniref:Similar to CG17672 n=1 Tax=Papilio xuthus TaxID=66420 RepID=I4DJW4_PAPXU|nr:uncharacterized protein LOC106125434 precursor [Papilio xuthus]KPI98034.1 hypothetical protein RR46_11155 [Papilio xuthus]BAM18204.1 similar to CG17672 [Papilio xuthus]
MCSKSISFYIYVALLASSLASDCGPTLKYAWGDALLASDCPGPDGSPYPRHLVNRALKSGPWGQSNRQGRGLRTLDPAIMRRALLEAHAGYGEASNVQVQNGNRTARASNIPSGLSPANPHTCGSARLCRTRYNTTAPMYGVSLTSGQPVTIVQKFPDLLQQVVFEVCETSECSVLRGTCTQTYVPYLFLVLPLGPVTLTGQDYVLVESGCVCKPDPIL